MVRAVAIVSVGKEVFNKDEDDAGYLGSLARVGGVGANRRFGTNGNVDSVCSRLLSQRFCYLFWSRIERPGGVIQTQLRRYPQTGPYWHTVGFYLEDSY